MRQGVVLDDGVIARLGAEHFYFTTTTSGASTDCHVFRQCGGWTAAL